MGEIRQELWEVRGKRKRKSGLTQGGQLHQKEKGRGCSSIGKEWKSKVRKGIWHKGNFYAISPCSQNHTLRDSLSLWFSMAILSSTGRVEAPWGQMSNLALLSISQSQRFCRLMQSDRPQYPQVFSGKWPEEDVGHQEGGLLDFTSWQKCDEIR